MATYVKGAPKYSVDIKPFTPDYKFLSAVLETRQDKYDTNFKATNDIYNKVVYADLSRTDTKERRDQYAEQISPQIEKISGMDLSLAQNFNAAKSVFAPFYDDELTVKDIVYTANYRDQSRYAQRLKNAANEDMNDKYSDIGVQGLNYRMEDFINASPEKALNMAIPKYVEDVKLFKVATEILEEMDPNLSLEMDRFGTDANGDPITDFIIREKNGRLIQGAALQTLQGALLNDPRVQRAYAERSFVQSRNFARDGMAAGTFSSVDQGQSAWATETINRINAIADQKETEKSEELETLESANVRWDNYKRNNGVIPGSQIDDAINENMDAAEATRIALDRIKGIKSVGSNVPDSTEGQLNKAYMMLMQYNINTDLSRAALSYSQRDQKYLIRENEFAVREKQFKYDMAKINANATNAMNLAILKGNLSDRNTMLEKGYQVGEDGSLIPLPWAEGMQQNNPLADLLGGNNTVFGSANTVDVPVDEEGDPDQNVDMILRTQQQYIEKDNALAQRQVDDIIDMIKILYPTGTDATGEQMGTGTWKISVPNKTNGTDDITVNNLEDMRTFLLDPRITGEGENAQMVGYKNREFINRAYDIISERFLDTRRVTMENNNTTLNKDTRNQYDDLYNRINGINGTNTQIAALSQFIGSVYENYANTYNTVKGNAMTPQADDGNNVKQLYEAGFPDIIDPETNIPYTKAEYLDIVLEGVKNKSITNPNLKGTIDTGTNNENYLIQKTETVPNPNYTGSNYSSPNRIVYLYNDDGTPQMIVDQKAVKDEAELIYNSLYKTLNQALTGVSGDFTSGDLDSEIYGISGKFSDVVSNPSYKRRFNPAVPNALAEREVAQMILQINDLENKGIPYGVVAGDIDNVEEAEELANVKSELGVKVFNMWRNEASLWLSGKIPSTSTSIKAPAATIIYNPVLGRAEDGEKTLAGYQIIFDPNWLASKKQGSNTSTGGMEFGALTTEEILQIQGRAGDDDEVGAGEGGITILFDQSLDLNPKAEKNTYYSFVEVDINKNGGFADYVVPNDNGINPTGEFRVNKIKPGEYTVYSKVYTYQPGGTYTVEENTVPIDMSQGLPGLDKQVIQYQKILEQKRIENRLAREQDEAENGQK